VFSELDHRAERGKRIPVFAEREIHLIRPRYGTSAHLNWLYVSNGRDVTLSVETRWA
jgi:hypothetical protein